jgi:cephalosporin-C deacetylase-like acetyl esterase
LVAAGLRANDKPPATKDEWRKRNEDLRKHLLEAWGGFPAEKCALDPQAHGELKRDGYRVEKLTFQTRPGVRMTANLYLPDKKGKLSAILMVHGHWKGAKLDPVVQARCIGAVKLGFVVLCVDAFGAGERGVGTALGEYHGEMTAATLLPLGLPLSGLQVYENMRAVDYLCTRPEVDADRIGITGASGGGNQTMYAGAWDERFKCVVPVCSVGNYQAYLGAACCMCEVVPGALKFTEEAGVLSLVAPRALMVVSATRDAFQFSVGEAKKSIAAAEPVFKLFDKPGHIRHAVFDSPHDYSRDMREAMYGWMTLHLKGEGDGSPIKEPEVKTENPEDLRCYPGDTRPKEFVTIPRFAAAEGKKLLAAIPEAKDAEKRRAALEKVLGGFPNVKAVDTWQEGFEGETLYQFRPEPGLTLPLSLHYDPVLLPKQTAPTMILLSSEKYPGPKMVEILKAALATGWRVIIFDLRATNRVAVRGDAVGPRAPDHNSAEWGLWIGRPLLGQWVADVRQYLSTFPKRDEKAPSREIMVVGVGPAGLVALCAAATDKRITKAAAVGTLASYVSDEPYVNQRLGIMAPGILRDVGDVPHIAALAAPKRVVIAGGVTGGGKPLTGDQLREAYRPAAPGWELTKAPKELVILEKMDAAAVVAALARPVASSEVKDPALRKELLDRVKTDQTARMKLIEAGNPPPANLFKEMMEADTVNRTWLKGVIEKRGWPGKSLVGEDGAHAAWLLVQHADADLSFQTKCLDLLKDAVKAGEATGTDLAYLTDRVLAAEGKKQIYGTQLELKDGKLVVKPVEDPDNLDKRRKEVGMMPMAEYLELAGKMYRR